MLGAHFPFAIAALSGWLSLAGARSDAQAHQLIVQAFPGGAAAAVVGFLEDGEERVFLVAGGATPGLQACSGTADEPVAPGPVESAPFAPEGRLFYLAGKHLIMHTPTGSDVEVTGLFGGAPGGCGGE